jgi:predicted RNA-binding Zn-ribbon protein involved in translation (DUF1610 family)
VNNVSEKKPVALREANTRGLCPVCGKASYSQTGTHPQCALARFDAADKIVRKAAADKLEREAPAGVAVRPENRTWFKKCPKCVRQIPARRSVCECGHSFPALNAQNGAPAAAAPKQKPAAKRLKPR